MLYAVVRDLDGSMSVVELSRTDSDPAYVNLGVVTIFETESTAAYVERMDQAMDFECGFGK